jgi:choline dehydrogenase-like flavoprotein
VIIDTREVPAGTALRCDLCIVGAGPAGIALAHSLRDRGRDVILLESGGIDFDASLEDLNKGEVVDPLVHGPLEDYRRRRLGGATTAWGGRCVPYDAIDFEVRSFVPDSGWPLTKRDLDPYYERAHVYFDLGAYNYSPKEVLLSPDRERPMIPGLVSDEVSTESLYLFSPPTNFGRKYREALASSPRVRVYLFANVLEMTTDAAGVRVTSVEVATPSGRKFTVAANCFVLAAGGLDVTRLLLCSNKVHPPGLGNAHDLVGRYYMCHAIHHVEVELRDKGAVWDYERTRDGAWCQRAIFLTEEKQRQYGLLNHRARIEHPDIADPSHGSGVLSATYLAKAVLMSQVAKRYLSDRVNVLSKGVLGRPPEGMALSQLYFEHGKNVVLGVGDVARIARRWLFDRILSDRKLPSLVMESEANSYTLRIDTEQAPNPASRVTLADDHDAFGQRRVRVDWRVTGLDRRCLEEIARRIGAAIADSGAGRIRSIPELAPQATGGHHIGTTRMAGDPTRGVVDANCKVHGVDNLYVASSSVFPTSSYANPTLTIVALALRLADHLAQSS